MQDRGRDDLIDDVQNGRMSPEAAEEEAARLGLPPLAPGAGLSARPHRRHHRARCGRSRVGRGREKRASTRPTNAAAAASATRRGVAMSEMALFLIQTTEAVVFITLGAFDVELAILVVAIAPDVG